MTKLKVSHKVEMRNGYIISINRPRRSRLSKFFTPLRTFTSYLKSKFTPDPPRAAESYYDWLKRMDPPKKAVKNATQIMEDWHKNVSKGGKAKYVN